MKKVVIGHLREGMISGQTVCNDRGIILVVEGASLTKSMITRLKSFDIDWINIKDESENELVQQPNISEATVQKTISAVKNLTDGIVDCRAVSIKKNISVIETIISSALDLSFVQNAIMTCAKDEILYEHSLRTAIFSTNMGLAKGYNELHLKNLAICALLHDCGMEQKFEENDFEHPFLGFIKLRDNLDIDMLVALVCLQHHEHYDGSGFPFGFSRTQIAEFSSLIAVADFYDRLLIKNSDPRKAMFQTIEKKNTLFDPAMIELFGSTIDWSRFYNISHSLPDKQEMHKPE